MIWVDREAQTIKKNATHNHAWVDDMKTPSGRIHVGALRGVVIHDLLYKSLLENGLDTKTSYVFNDLDQMDAIPSYLKGDEWKQYGGVPLCNIPSPEEGYANYAEYFAKEFIATFEAINCHPQIIWSSELYRTGKMNDVVKMALDRADRVRDIYSSVSKSKRKDDWLPIQPICEKCGKMGTTYAYAWDGKKIKYRCDQTTKWATACGHTGSMSPFDGKAKLHWKADWPAYWKVIGVTVEWSGKDHMSEGGSYDVSSRISKEVYDYDAPYAKGYEWFTVGGKKMSSSKGIGTSAKEVSSILPPELLRFLLVRTPMERHLDFDPFGDTIPNLFDEYDRCLNAFFDKREGITTAGKQGQVNADFARIIELSIVRPLPDNRIFLPRFRTVANLLKQKQDIKEFFETQKGNDLTPEELEILEERAVFAEVYIKNYAGEDTAHEFLEEAPEDLQLTDAQTLFLKTLGNNLSRSRAKGRDQVQDVVFASLKEHDLKPRDVFSAFYQILIGRDAGPKAADLILEFGIRNVVERINQVV